VPTSTVLDAEVAVTSPRQAGRASAEGLDERGLAPARIGGDEHDLDAVGDAPGRRAQPGQLTGPAAQPDRRRARRHPIGPGRRYADHVGPLGQDVALHGPQLRPGIDAQLRREALAGPGQHLEGGGASTGLVERRSE
jgi:hypothetical protein